MSESKPLNDVSDQKIATELNGYEKVVLAVKNAVIDIYNFIYKVYNLTVTELEKDIDKSSPSDGAAEVGDGALVLVPEDNKEINASE
jgi:hypothetical protein